MDTRKYAILGATGNTGSQLLYKLARQEGAEVAAYARSQEKLDRLWPSTPSANLRAHVGPLSTDIIAECITDAQVVFLVLSTNRPQPTVTVTTDAATVLIEALQRRRAQHGSDLPLTVLLSSASLHSEFSKSSPAPVRWLLWAGIGSVYRDVEEATRRLRAASIPLAVVYPGGLVDGAPSTGVTLSKTQHSDVISYGDLAMGMIAAASASRPDRGEESEQSWGLIAESPPAPWQLWPNAINFILPGVICTYMPFLWHIGARRGWW